MTTTFTGLQQQVVAELRPLTALETWFANEVALATWQEQQAHASAANMEPAPQPAATYNRAHKGIDSAQTTRVAAAAPLATVSRVPSLRTATSIDIALNSMDPGVLSIIRQSRQTQ